MAVVSTKEIKTRQGSETNLDIRTYTRTWYVITDDPDDGSLTARNAPGIVVGSSTYATSTETDNSAICIKIDATCVSEDGLQWETTAEYETWTSPLDEPAEYSWSFAQFDKIIDSDIFGTPIVNSTGLPFSDPVVRDDSRPILTVKVNQSSFNVSLAAGYRDAVNSSSFLGAPPDTVKVSNISATSQWDVNIGTYYQATYSFSFDFQDYKLKLIDQGYYYLDAGTLKPILNQGVPTQEPQLLDGSGAVLGAGGTPAVGRWDIYPRLPFGVFGF